MASQFDDMVTGLEAKSGYRSDSSNQDLNFFLNLLLEFLHFANLRVEFLTSSFL